MTMFSSGLLLWSAWSCFVAAQDWRDYVSLCDDTIDKANAVCQYHTVTRGLSLLTLLRQSSVYTYEPDLHSRNGRPAPVSWAYTVYHNATTLQSVWWYNTGGANYSDDFGTYVVSIHSTSHKSSMTKPTAEATMSVHFDSEMLQRLPNGTPT